MSLYHFRMLSQKMKESKHLTLHSKQKQKKEKMTVQYAKKCECTRSYDFTFEAKGPTGVTLHGHINMEATASKDELLA